jgi:hypothetical protein
MDEMSLETFQGAVEIQPQQQMRDIESLMCHPHTYFFKDTFIDDFSTMNPAVFAESLVETFIHVLDSSTCPVRRAGLVTFSATVLLISSTVTLRISRRCALALHRLYPQDE